MLRIRKRVWVILITLLATISSIGVHSLYAFDTITLEQEVKHFDGMLKSVVIEQAEAELKTCQYPENADEDLCSSFLQKEDGIYQSAQAPSGSFQEDGFQPYSYTIIYEQDGIEQRDTITLERIEETAILGFQGKELLPDTWTELEIIGDYHNVSFSCDTPGVEIEHGKVKATSEVTSFTVIARDDGNATRTGGSVSAEFTVRSLEETTKDGIEQNKNESAAIPYADPSFKTNWQSGVYTYYTDRSLDNGEGTFTSVYNNKIKIQGQFVNIKDGVHFLPAGKTPATLTSAEVDELFKNAIRNDGTAFDLTQPYTYDHVWTQTLRLQWPDEEGIFLYRYRLYDSDGGNIIWRENDDGSLIIDAEDGWVYEPRTIIGQDFTSPEVVIYAKKTGEGDFHILQEEESLEDGDQIKITAQDDLSGLTSFQYKLVKDDEDPSLVAFLDVEASGEKIITLDDTFHGGTLYVEAKNGNKNNGLTQASSHILGAVNYVTISLPSNSDVWTSTETMGIKVNEPKHNVIDYDGVLITFDGIEEAPKYFPKTAENVFTLPLPDGEYTIIAKAVKENGMDKEPVDEHTFLSTQKIDHTSTLKTELLSKRGEAQPVKLTITSGPSKIKEVKKSCTNTKNETFKDVIRVRGYQEAYTYEDVLNYNAVCTYTAVNNASKESEPKQVRVTDLNNSDPVISITARDFTGKTIKSSEPAERYVTLQAVNRNPEFQGKLKVCINQACKAYRFGKDVVVDTNATVRFVSDTTPEQVYETFEVVLASSISLGELQVENEAQYQKEHWYSESQTIHAGVIGGDDDAYLAYKIDAGEWIKTKKKKEVIIVSQAANTSQTHTLSLRSEKGEQFSTAKIIQVNIDSVKPTLQLKMDQDHMKLQAVVGESGIASLDMIGPDGNMSLLNHVNSDGTIKDYIVQHNGTYHITLKNHAGVEASSYITVTGIDEEAFHIVMTSNDAAYDGAWTNKDVTLAWTGGYKTSDAFDHYECRIDKTDWKACTSPLVMTKEGVHTIQLRSMTQAGKEIKTSTSYEAKLDHNPPTIPIIEMKKLHTQELYKFIRAISFGQYFNETVRASIDSTDALSKVSIYYQFTDVDGNFIKDPKDPKWNSYTTAMDLDTEGSVQLVAYACDEAGNCSEVSSSDGAVLDFHAPSVQGIKEGEKEGYIPRVLTYEDSLSGIDETKSTISQNGKALTLIQSMLIETPAQYQLEVYDKAGNITKRDFTLVEFPKPENITGDDKWKDIIDQIEKEYKENKDSLSDDKQKELEDEIQKLKDAFAKQRVEYLIDPDSGARLQGVDGTTFDKEARLQVKRISDSFSEEDQSHYEQMVTDGALQEVYTVKLFKGKEELTLNSPAELRVELAREADTLLFMNNDLVTTLDAKIQDLTLNVRIVSTGTYLTAISEEQNNQADQNHPNDSNGSTPSGQGENDMSGNYLNSVNTGDKQKAGVLLALLVMSSGLMLRVIGNRRNKKDGKC